MKFDLAIDDFDILYENIFLFPWLYQQVNWNTKNMGAKVLTYATKSPQVIPQRIKKENN